MQLNDFYISVGGNYETVLARLQSEQIIQKFLLRFLKDQTYNDLKKAVDAKDAPTAFLAVHTLMGTAANLGLDTLASDASALTELLRGAAEFPDGISTSEVDKSYYAAIKSIAMLEA